MAAAVQDRRCGGGGLGPIIIGGLRYGVGNLYRAGVPAGAPVTGPPPATHLPYLTQPNTPTTPTSSSRGASVGKVVVAINRRQDMLMLLVQRHSGSAGRT